MNKYYFHIGTQQKSPMHYDGCLAQILEKYSNLFAERKSSFQIGSFKFEVRPHSTGSSVTVCIIHPEGESRTIISATYWYWPNYTFYSSTFESGAWDFSLERILDKMANEIQEREKQIEESKQKRTQEKEQAEKEKKAKFEALFV